MTIRDIAIAFSYELDKGSEQKVESSVDNLKSKATKASNSAKEGIKGIGSKLKGVGKNVKEVKKDAGASLQTLKAIAKTVLSIAAMKAAFNFLKEYSSDAKALSQRILDIRDAFGKWIAKTDKQLQITKTLTRIVDKLWNAAEKGLKKVTDWIDRIINFLGSTEQALALIGAAVGAIFLMLNMDSVIKFMTVLKNLLSVAALKAMLLAASLLLVYIAIDDIVAFMQGRDSLLGSFLDAAGIDADKFREKIKANFNAIRTFVTETFSSIGSSILNGLSIAIGYVQGHASEIATAISSSVKAVETILNGIGTFISSFFKGLTNQTDGKAAFESFMNSMISAITKLATFINEHQAQINAFFDIFGKVAGTALLISIRLVIAVLKVLVGIVKGVVKAFTTFKSGATTAINGVKKAFDKLKSAVSSVVNSIKAKFNSIKTAINSVKRVFTNLASAVKSKMKSVKTAVSDGITGAKKALVKGITSMLSSVKKVFGDIYDAIATKISDAKQKIVDTLNEAVDFIKGLAESAFQWGADIIQGIIDGIQSKVEAVIAAVSNIAALIKSILGFSVPEKGPLSDFDTYMPDMMDLMSKGIKGNKYKVMAEVEGVAKGMSVLGNVNAKSGVSRSLYNSNSTSRSVVQNLTFNQQFNGERAIQEKSAKAAKSNSNDITGQLARALAYT